MNRTQSNMDKRAIVFFTQKKFFCPFVWAKRTFYYYKKSVFYYNFLWEKIARIFQSGYDMGVNPLSEHQEKIP